MHMSSRLKDLSEMLNQTKFIDPKGASTKTRKELNRQADLDVSLNKGMHFKN